VFSVPAKLLLLLVVLGAFASVFATGPYTWG
jgi:hypothetical protein